MKNKGTSRVESKMSSNRIKKLRKDAGISQTELAKATGIAQQTLARWENGSVKLTAKRVEKLVEYFQVPAELLLTPVDESSPRYFVQYIGGQAASPRALKEFLETKRLTLLPSSIERLKLTAGDSLYIAIGISWPKDSDIPRPPGFPRISPELDTFVCALKHLYYIKLTSEPRLESLADSKKKYTASFEIEHELEGTYIGKEHTEEALTFAIMKSLNRQGSIVPLYPEPKHIKPYLESDAIATKVTQDYGRVQKASELKISERKGQYRSVKRPPVMIAAKKKEVFDATGDLACEICGFSFHKVYGQLGHNYIEAHIDKPLTNTEKETIDNIVLLCSNCHKMIHRPQPRLSVEQLREIFNLRNIKSS